MTATSLTLTGIFIFLSCWISQARSSEDECQRHLEFNAAKTLWGKRLRRHVIRNAYVMDQEFCAALCFMEHNCASYNLMTISENEKHNCELNNATREEHEEDLEDNPNYVYYGTKNLCASTPCDNKATCQTGFKPKGYRCLCHAGYTGQDCKTDIDECATGTSSCDDDAVCTNNNGWYNCSCKAGYHGDGIECEDIDECATGTSSCDDDAKCTNTKGSYNCSCKAGYHGDGVHCEDIDECATGTSSCDDDAVCTNTKGSFICSCKAGYHGDGLECEATPTTISPTTAECLLKTLAGRCCSIPFSYEGVTYHACTTVHNSGVLWCSLDPIYNNRWGNCA